MAKKVTLDPQQNVFSFYEHDKERQVLKDEVRRELLEELAARNTRHRDNVNRRLREMRDIAIKAMEYCYETRQELEALKSYLTDEYEDADWWKRGTATPPWEQAGSCPDETDWRALEQEQPELFDDDETL